MGAPRELILLLLLLMQCACSPNLQQQLLLRWFLKYLFVLLSHSAVSVGFIGPVPSINLGS